MSEQISITEAFRSANPKTWANTNRWWIYQRERFPLVKHGLLIAVFSACAVAYSSMLRGETAFPPVERALVAFATVFAFFWMLRVADEFKDFEEDLKFRPYRPVQRGLIRLRELGFVSVGAAILQLALCLWLSVALLPLLLVTWLYLGLMSKEFFARRWLKAHPFTYMWTHMFIMPLVDLYATGCDWISAGQSHPRATLIWFLIVSFFNGVVLEVGRKIRAPRDEEYGVETYSALWGTRAALLLWLGALLVSASLACLAGAQIDRLFLTASTLGIFFLVAVVVGARFWLRETTANAKMVENFSGIWVLAMYLTLGALPFLLAA